MLWYACAVPRSQIFRPALTRGRADGRRIAITFDDGPAPPFTEQILDILSDYKVKATFFVCGKDAERHPETIRRIVGEGHALGNHTFSHPYLFPVSQATMAEEIDRTQEAIEQIVGRRPVLFQPPYGVRWFGLDPVLRLRGMRMVLWSVNGKDWKNDAAGVVRACLRNLDGGAVLLLHDGQQEPRGILRGFFQTAGGGLRLAA